MAWRSLLTLASAAGAAVAPAGTGVDVAHPMVASTTELALRYLGDLDLMGPSKQSLPMSLLPRWLLRCRRRQRALPALLE